MTKQTCLNQVKRSVAEKEIQGGWTFGNYVETQTSNFCNQPYSGETMCFSLLWSRSLKLKYSKHINVWSVWAFTPASNNLNTKVTVAFRDWEDISINFNQKNKDTIRRHICIQAKVTEYLARNFRKRLKLIWFWRNSNSLLGIFEKLETESERQLLDKNEAW